jgi:CDP-glucose 4,6-dehydratase
MNVDFWNKKRILITGHTGFKGSWLCLLLHSLGAEISGYALNPPSEPNLFDLCQIGNIVQSHVGDVRDLNNLMKVAQESRPEIVIHMAAQSLVRASYADPVITYETNVMGTVNILETIRRCNGIRVFINVTSDKCYENKEWVWGYRENEPLGGFDPYSNSKACSELVTVAYRNSFFNPEKYEEHGVAIASVRAGNVIGGGDWAKDRLMVDCINALLLGEKVRIRNPNAIRPWQHVLEPLAGYVTLAEKLHAHGSLFAEGWNFGPNEGDARPVLWIVEQMCQKWQGAAGYVIDEGNHPHEAHYLKLDCAKAKARLQWHPRWSLEKAIDAIIEWTLDYRFGRDVRRTCLKQIAEYIQGDQQ